MELTTEFQEKTLEKSLLDLEKALEINLQEIIKIIVQLYDQLFIKIKQNQEQGKLPIAHINFYILRTSLKLGRYTCVLKAYTKDWYLDKEPIEIHHEADYVYKHYYNYANAMKSEQKKYIRADFFKLQTFLIEQWDNYIPYIIFVLRSSLADIIELDSFNFEKDENFKMSIGDYKDFEVRLL